MSILCFKQKSYISIQDRIIDNKLSKYLNSMQNQYNQPQPISGGIP